MKYLTLVGAGLRRRPFRSVLTVLAVAVAFLLFGVLHGVVSSFDRALDLMSDARLRVMSRANLLETIPIAYRQRLLGIDGVTGVVPVAIFVGYFQNPTQRFNGAGIDLAEFLEVMPEVQIPPDQRAALLGNRTGAVAGAQLAERFGWTVGDRIPVISQLWLNESSGQDWTFDLEAIANGSPGDNKAVAQELWFHYDYLDESRSAGKGRVHQFILSIDDPARADAIANEVDSLFANSADETITLDEKQYLRSNLRRIGDVEAFVYYILSAVLFTLLFMTGINVLQAIRERTPELGIMRALGFEGSSLGLLVLLEAAALCLAGAALGMLAAGVLFPSVFATFGVDGVRLAPTVYAQALALALTLAVVASVWPAWRAATVNVVSAIEGRRR
jgi:putative ABC transport system permease protein